MVHLTTSPNRKLTRIQRNRISQKAQKIRRGDATLGLQALHGCCQQHMASEGLVSGNGADLGEYQPGAEHRATPRLGAHQKAPNGTRDGGFVGQGRLSP